MTFVAVTTGSFSAETKILRIDQKGSLI